MKILEINFGDMVGNSLNFRNNEELKGLVELFAKYLKVKKYNYYVNDLTIHITTAKFSYDISEKRTDKFTIVKEDLFNNRQIKYAQIVQI